VNVAFYTCIYISYTDHRTVSLPVKQYFIKGKMTSIHSSGGGSGSDQSTSTKG